MEHEKLSRFRWEKLGIVTTIVATTILPLLLAAMGWRFDKGLQERQSTELRAQQERDHRLSTAEQQRDREIRLFELALGILQQDPTENSEMKALRGWAMEIFKDISGREIPPDALEELKKHPLPRITPAIRSSVDTSLQNRGLRR